MSRELYNKVYYIHARDFQLRKSRVKYSAKRVMKSSPKKVLDVGCGLCTLVKYLREEGVEAYGVDFAQTLKDDFGIKEGYFVIADAKELPFEDNFFDVVISTDFFEHIAEEDIDKVLEEMKRVGGKVIAWVAYKAKLNLRQTRLHQTNKSEEWWKKKLEGVELI